MNYSVRLKENDGKYSVIKEGGKRALRVFKSKQEALDYIKTNNLNLVEETMDVIVNVPLIEKPSSVNADSNLVNPNTQSETNTGSFLSRIFNSIEWATISGSTANLKISYPGVQTVTINSPVSGGVSNYYIARLGNSN